MSDARRSRVAAGALICALLLHGACTPAIVHGPGQGDALSRAITVRLRGHRYTKKAGGEVEPGSQAPLSSGVPIRSGDVFDLEVLVDRTAHVQLVHLRPDGSAQWLTSSSDAQPLEPGTHRVPTDEDSYLRFGDKPGRELFLLVASSRPLDAADPALAKLFGVLRQASGKPVAAIQYRPPAVDGSRATDAPSEGLVFHGRGVVGRRLGPELLAGHTDDTGLAAFRIELDHVGTPAP